LRDQTVLAHVALEDTDRDVRRLAVGKLTDQSALAQVALQEPERDIREVAVGQLTDQTALTKVVEKDKDWDVRKAAFGKLTETELAKLIVEAKDRAVQMAAAVKQGQKTWSDVFSDSYSSNDDLRDALDAVELAGDKSLATNAIVQTCHKFIRQGDVTRLPELKDLLTLYGNRLLAEDYMNCGQPYLRALGEAWCRAHGYTVAAGSGSHRVRWGSTR